jgi:hypothetical protein
MNRVQAKKEIGDEIKCICGKRFTAKQGMHDTAWSGVYWCGDTECADIIMGNECTPIDFNEEVDTWMAHQ